MNDQAEELEVDDEHPAKYHGLRGYGITVTGRVPLFAPITLENKTYLEAKRKKMGHLFDTESGDFGASLQPRGDADVVIQKGKFVFVIYIYTHIYS